MNKPKIIVDPNIWVTQKEYARLRKMSKQLVNIWIARGKLEAWNIPELGVTLVKK